MRVCAVDTATPQSTGVRLPVVSVELAAALIPSTLPDVS
jgi:hypothetical protein